MIDNEGVVQVDSNKFFEFFSMNMGCITNGMVEFLSQEKDHENLIFLNPCLLCDFFFFYHNDDRMVNNSHYTMLDDKLWWLLVIIRGKH